MRSFISFRMTEKKQTIHQPDRFVLADLDGARDPGSNDFWVKWDFRLNHNQSGAWIPFFLLRQGFVGQVKGMTLND